ncbi:ArgE/DapE family deacylase [Listeria monocytogenes]|uniref:Probable succinyl-diaminopimelate desuccinylase n=3 Tax=Listeria monocytogenes TaxID=1639 RepID=A0A0E0UTM6_LISMM|nr:ArgE/DapE family deacylase [Listeria monocytogenes]ACK40706.1 peptidase, ArgE/DapE family [Listeria monocytogenes HCC23]AEH91300.1 putative succinyl-diaminopimelate desuccinylase [Listeria monocytogenes M7]AKS52885.1 succinyl-diaminopimelate desuccinylase [Listeria monocytogenes]EAC6862082.1 ArgE/DapE family deacylase [Listeria monocytogenes]EAD0183393.1 ArgE/DapE family deacylase [Listeria monocytogenes]
MERERKIQILKDIVNIDSTNGHEEQVANYLQKLFAEYGIESEKVQYDVDRASLVSEIGSNDGKVLAFSGHMDVVDAGDVSKWKFPPFEAAEHEGKIYGRGATDMKSGLAAMVIAMIELHEEKQKLNGKIRLLATVGEEVGELGAEQLTQKGYADDLDGLIIGEPSGHRIVYAHKGSINYTVKSTGKNAHSSMPEFGVNAIDNLLLFYNEVEKFVKSIDATNEILGDFIHNVTVIDGGNQVNSIPEKALLQGNIRSISEMDNETVKQVLVKIINKLNKQENVNLELIFDYDKQPVFSDKNSDLVHIAKSVASDIVKEEIPLLGISGTTDAAEFTKAKKEFPVIIFGPGNETPHQVNENVSIENYLEMVDVYKRIATEFLS